MNIDLDLGGRKKYMHNEINQREEEVLDELAELEADQHCRYFKHEQKGREHMAFLLLKLNAIEKEKD